MIIIIDDHKDPDERKTLLEVIPIKYALQKFKKREDAAKFLGITPRCLRNRIAKHKLLAQFITKPPKYDWHGRRIDRFGKDNG